MKLSIFLIRWSVVSFTKAIKRAHNLPVPAKHDVVLRQSAREDNDSKTTSLIIISP